MLITIDPNAGAVFDQVADAVTVQIAAGDLQQGERLPAARDLADALGVNVHTVLHGYQRLRDDGLIELRRGRGAVVTGAVAVEAVQAAVVAAVRVAREHHVGAAALAALIRKEYQS